MLGAVFGSWGGWIGRELARGNPKAIVAAIAVPIVFAALYRMEAWWLAQ